MLLFTATGVPQCGGQECGPAGGEHVQGREGTGPQQTEKGLLCSTRTGKYGLTLIQLSLSKTLLYKFNGAFIVPCVQGLPQHNNTNYYCI